MKMKMPNKMLLCKVMASMFLLMGGSNIAYADPGFDPGSFKNPDPGIEAGSQLQQMEQALSRARTLQEIEENRGKKTPQVTDALEAQKEKQVVPQQEIKFQLQQIHMGQSRALTAEEISNITKKYINRDIVIQDIYKMLDEINALYAAKGYVTCRVFLEPQTIKDGTLDITLIEGRVYNLVIKGIKNTKDNYILNRMHIKAGDIPNIQQLNKDLLRFNANNNLQLNVTLKPGAKENTTDVVIEGKEPQQQQLTVFTDNAGNESSGIYRGGAFWTINSISGVQDNLTLGVVMSKGTRAFSSNYSLPIGRSGTKLNLGYSTNSVYSVESPVGLPSDYIRGHANSYSVGVAQPLVTNERTRSQITFDLNRQNSVNSYYMDPTNYFTWQDSTVTDATLGFNMTNYGDSWVAYQRHGIVFGKQQGDANSGSGDTNTNYALYKFNGFFQKAYQHGQAFNFRLEAQKSSRDDLVSARQFFIGGMYTVRGYAENYLGGDGGFDMSLEYQFPLDKQRKVNGYLFWDYGAVYGGSAESYGGDRTLASVGFGIKANLGKHYFANLVLGCPLKREFGVKEEYVSRARVNFMLSGTF